MLSKIVEDYINKTSKLKVLLIGETIVDQFVKVFYEGYSMKSACPVIKLMDEKTESQMGGTSAIAGHLRNFVRSVDVITNTKEEIVKTRYVDRFDNKKFFEINKFDTKNFKPIKANTKDYDLTIVADFGHGFCDKLQINDGFHLMCQTNSNNFGFNRLSKWKKYRKKSVSLDLREASLQVNHPITDKKEDIHELFNYELNTDSLFVTLGSKGSVYTDGKRIVKHPSYPSKIVDTIGAGDTYFAFACMLAAVEKKIDTLAVPSLAASLSTTWLCNEQAVTKKGLLKYADQFE